MTKVFAVTTDRIQARTRVSGGIYYGYYVLWQGVHGVKPDIPSLREEPIIIVPSQLKAFVLMKRGT